MKMFSLIAHRGGIFASFAMLCPLPSRSRPLEPIVFAEWGALAATLDRGGIGTLQFWSINRKARRQLGRGLEAEITS